MRALVAYLRERTKLWAVGAVWGGALLAAFSLYAATATYIPGYLVRNDFRLVYGAALNAWQHGYGHLYDLAGQKAAVESLGAYWQPYLNPPPLAWLATPFLALQFGVAIVAWTFLMLAGATFAWRFAAPGVGVIRAAHLALFLGLFPTAFGLLVGQPVALVAAVVATSWWLAERDRPIFAGLVLSLIAVKPQLALLVPLCLLVAGRWRTFGAWAAATAALVVASLLLLGGEGLQRYRDALSLASQWESTRGFAIAGPLGLGPQFYVVEVIVVAVACVAAWRHRREGVGALYATGIVASLLFTPYVGFQDFAMLVVAGWLVIRSGATQIQIALMVVGYALLELCLVVQAVPILLAEAALFVSMLWPFRSPPASEAFASSAKRTVGVKRA